MSNERQRVSKQANKTMRRRIHYVHTPEKMMEGDETNDETFNSRRSVRSKESSLVSVSARSSARSTIHGLRKNSSMTPDASVSFCTATMSDHCRSISPARRISRVTNGPGMLRIVLSPKDPLLLTVPDSACTLETASLIAGCTVEPPSTLLRSSTQVFSIRLSWVIKLPFRYRGLVSPTWQLERVLLVGPG